MLTSKLDGISEVLRYENGKLYWRVVSKYHKRKQGMEAGCLVESKGKQYWGIRYRGVKIRRHQIVFFMFNGYVPKIVDHINGDSLDDRPENLREADALLNARNHKRRNIRLLPSGKYQIRLGGISCGVAESYSDAVNIYDKKRSELWGV